MVGLNSEVEWSAILQRPGASPPLRFLSDSCACSKGVLTMKHWRSQTRLRLPRAWLLTLSILGGLIFGVWGLRNFSTTNSSTQPAWSFTNTDNAALQQRDLITYVEADQRPHRVVQVDLAQHPKISQFTDIDSSAPGYGRNACALVAAAVAILR